MAQFDDEAPPEGYRWEYSGSGNTAVRYPVLAAPTAEPSLDRPIAPHREVAGEVPGTAPTLDQMRFELSQQPQSIVPSLPEYLANMPREIRDQAMALYETGLGTFGSMVSPVAAAATGAGKNIYDYFTQGQVNPKATDETANRAAQLFSYQPVMPSAQSLLQTMGEAPAAIMGTGQGLPPIVSGINPRALQMPRGTTGALTAGVKRDLGQFDNDVFNAQRGITPGYPTLGSEFSNAFVTPRPTVYDMLAGLEPSNIPSTASAAVKTKGGNFPTSFGNDLEVSGQIGRHLDKLLKRIDSPVLQLSNQFFNNAPASLQYQLFRTNKGMSRALTNAESILLIDEFVNTHKEQFPELKTFAELEARRDAEKAFLTNQYARYLTNEMGTGAKTDTLVRLAEQGIAVPEIAQVFDVNYPGRAADLEGPWVLPAVRNLLEANKLKGIEAVQQTATTPFGKYIESLTDEGVTPTSKKLYEDFLTLQKQLGLPTKYADTPTPFERIPEDTPIWDLPELWSNTELGLDRILNKLKTDLRTGAVKPENVKNVSMESLVRGLMNEHLQKLAAEAKELSTFPTVYQRPGSKNVWKSIVDEADDAKTVAMHKRVGDKMGICIGDADYCDRAISKKGFHDVLFGPNGEPHVAVESQPATLLRAYNTLSRKDRDMLNDETAKELGYTLQEALNDTYPGFGREDAFVEARANAYLKHFGTPLPEIYQVKGKGNATTLDPKYVEDTRDFLNSREWLPSDAKSKDFSRLNNVTIGGLVDTQYDKSLNAYAERIKHSPEELKNRFEAAKLLGRQLPGRFATDKDITEFINGPETLQYNHGALIPGLKNLSTEMTRTRTAGTGLWLVEPFETAGTYAGMQGSIYGVEVKNKDFDVVDAKNSPNNRIPIDVVIYHADGTTTEVAKGKLNPGQTTLTTDDLARFAKANGSKGLHILNVSDQSGRGGAFHNAAPEFANNLVIFDPSLVKIVKEDRVADVAPAPKVENMPGLTVYRGGNQDLDALTKRYNGVYYATEPRTASQYGEVKQYELPGNLKTFKLWSDDANKNFINDEPTLRAILKDLGKDEPDITDAATRMFISPPKNLGEVLKKYGYDSMQAHDMLFVPKANTPDTKAEGGAVRMADGGAVTDTLDKMVKSPQASNLLNLDLPNLIAAKQQLRPMKRGGKVQFSNNIDDMRYALTRRQG